MWFYNSHTKIAVHITTKVFLRNLKYLRISCALFSKIIFETQIGILKWEWNLEEEKKFEIWKIISKLQC